MTRLTSIAVAAVLLFQPSLDVAAQAQPTIPQQFRGDWAASTARCGRPGESRLTIGATTIDFYESRGRVLAVTTDGAHALGLRIEASGEGQIWIHTRRFTLSTDGRTLTDVTNRREPFARVRCPPAVRRSVQN